MLRSADTNEQQPGEDEGKSLDQESEDQDLRASRSADGQGGVQPRDERSFNDVIISGYYEKYGQKCHQVPKTQCHQVPVKDCQTIRRYQKTHTSSYPKPTTYPKQYGPY